MSTMSRSRYFYFWCSNCPTRVTVETEVPAAADYPDPHYHFAMSEGVGSARVAPAEPGDDGLVTADLCPACDHPLHDLDDLTARQEVPYHDDSQTPQVHAEWLAKVKKEERG